MKTTKERAIAALKARHWRKYDHIIRGDGNLRVMCASDLSVNARLVWLLVQRLYKPTTGWLQLNRNEVNREVAERLAFSRPEVERAFQELKRTGYIKRDCSVGQLALHEVQGERSRGEPRLPAELMDEV